MNKKSRQKFKYLEKEKSFYDEIEQIFRFWRAIIELNFFFEGERPITNKQISKIYYVIRISKLILKNHTVNQPQPTINIKLPLKTCQNLLVVAGLPCQSVLIGNIRFLQARFS